MADSTQETPPEDTAAAAPRRKRRRTGSYTAADPRRQLIVETAISHFARLGYYNSSLPKIAADVGISQTGLLHHFGSKQELLKAVLEARENHAVEMFFSRLDQQHPDPVDLLGLIADQADFNATQPGLTQMYAVLSTEACNPDHPAHAYFQERYQRVIAFIAQSMRHGIDTGTVKADTDPEAIAREILATSDGFQVQFGLSGGTWNMTAALRAYLDRLARTLTTDGTGLRGA
ncbi:TetR/AcrR family transcriptional regulator [Kitasatospora sp. NPDC057198]|uniref:TetR/AcrR family transcriptional regulator n=1 Tax=Kitasatospora sp. NPDC057198 TaxID=3346046 RepID=UPI0036263577